MFVYQQNQPRGQALVETAVTALILCFLFSAIIFITREQVLNERLQQALYTTSAIFSASHADVDWSTASIFTNLNGAKGLGISPGSCVTPSSTMITGTNQTGNSGATFFAPVLSGALKSCSGRTLYSGFPSGEPAIILLSTTVSISNASNTKAIGNAFLRGLQNNISVTTTTFRAADAKSMINCFPDVARVMKNTLEPMKDATNPTTVPPPFPASWQPAPLSVNASC